MTAPVLTGLAAAVAVSLLRARLRLGLPCRSEPRPRWSLADVLLVLCLVFLALALRLALLESRPVDNDEPVGLGLASLAEWARERDARLHPPLPALFMTWAGGAEDFVRARNVSVLAGVATVALVFAAVRASAGRGLALVAGLFLAVMPAAIHTAQLARGYSLAALALIAAHVCLDKALSSGKERWFVAHSLAATAALASEYVTLAPLFAAALVSLRRTDRSRTIGVIGALGAALCLTAFMAPLAWPTLALGVGGGPHVPTGPGRALADLLAHWSGAAAPFNALLGLALVAGAARRRALGEAELRALAAVTAAVVVLVAFSFVTAVRARYVLPVLPLFVCLVVASARGLGRFGAVIAAFVALGHASLLPAYFAGRAEGPELSTGRRTPLTLALLAADPLVPVAVVPDWSIAEASHRLEGRFPGRDAGGDCPAELCVRGRRTLYGASLASLPGLVEREPLLYVWIRSGPLELPPRCGVILREADAALARCASR